jgi:hypothetical protein
LDKSGIETKNQTPLFRPRTFSFKQGVLIFRSQEVVIFRDIKDIRILGLSVKHPDCGGGVSRQLEPACGMPAAPILAAVAVMLMAMICKREESSCTSV